MASHQNEAPQLTSNGNIGVSLFVKLDTTTPFSVLQSDANAAQLVGVSGTSTDNAPGLSGATAYHAVDGENVELFGEGSICLLKAGTPWVTGDYLESDANGAGVPSTVAGHYVGAHALQSAATGDYGRVVVKMFQHQ